MSKSRGPTKAEQILAESKERVSKARNDLTKARTEWQIAERVYQSMESAHFDLERTLATTRKKRTPKLNPPSTEAGGATLLPEMIEGEKKKARAPKQTPEMPDMPAAIN